MPKTKYTPLTWNVFFSIVVGFLREGAAALGTTINFCLDSLLPFHEWFSSQVMVVCAYVTLTTVASLLWSGCMYGQLTQVATEDGGCMASLENCTQKD